MVESDLFQHMLAETTRILDLPISNRVKNALIDSGIFDVETLKEKTLQEIKQTPRLGSSGLIELREFLYTKYKFVFKVEKKEKKKVLKDFSSSKKVVEHFISGTEIDWPRQLRIADALLKKYSLEFLLSIKPKEGIYSLFWYNSEYGDKYIGQNSPLFLVEEAKEKPVKQNTETIDSEFVSRKIDKPKTLSDFLKING